MKKSLLSLVAIALVLCVATAKAELASTTAYDAEAGTISAADGSWAITDLFGTAIPTGNYRYTTLDNVYWTLDFTPEEFEAVLPGSPYFSWLGDVGVFTIETAFNLDAATTDSFLMYFWNFSSQGLISMYLNDELLEMTWPGYRNEGTVTFDLANAVVGENKLTFVLDNTLGGSGSNNIGVGFMAESTEPPVTPEPATMMIFGLGVIGAGFAARRRIQQ